MKVKIFAVVLMLTLLSAVIVNTLMVEKVMTDVCDEVEMIEIKEGETDRAYTEADAAFDRYKGLETYISLTVNHNDLTNIEDTFCELLGNLSVGEANGAIIAKNRLLGALSHLRRLSGINFDAII